MFTTCRQHYNVNMTAVQVGHDLLNLTVDGYVVGGKTGAIIDSGTTLAYLPEFIYEQLVKKVSHSLVQMILILLQRSLSFLCCLCFRYSPRSWI